MVRMLFVAMLTVITVSGHASNEPQKIRFYFACNNCEFDFVRTQISYVDYVRDPADADVHGYVVEESAANGGSRYTFTFLGRKSFEGISDTLQFTKKQSDTQEDFRTNVLRTLSLGLARYVSHSGELEQLSVVYKPRDTTSQVPPRDPWDSWVLSTDANAYLFGEQSHAFVNYWGSVNANRITPDWKVRLDLEGAYQQNRYVGLDTVTSHSTTFDGLAVKSLSNHWSLGPSLALSSSTFTNKRLAINGSMGLEYDIFPYSESTSRQIRLLYKLGVVDYHYFDSTIYNKLQDRVGVQSLSIASVFAQPWGSLEVSVYGQQFLHDLTMNELSIYGSIQWRVVEGLSLRTSGNYTIVRDQISLVKGTLSESDILLQKQQLSTNYTYYTSIGLVYTFGSIYNNVVNPRFGN